MARPKTREPINEDYENFGIKLAELRKGKGLSQAELARETGIATSSIAEYETGVQRIQLSNIKLLAKYFKISVDELIGNNLNSRLIINLDPVRDRQYRKWSKELKAERFTDEEIDELINYAKFIISKREV